MDGSEILAKEELWWKEGIEIILNHEKAPRRKRSLKMPGEGSVPVGWWHKRLSVTQIQNGEKKTRRQTCRRQALCFELRRAARIQQQVCEC